MALRVGIVGTGIMGGYHTRVASMSDRCELVGIFDADNARTTAIATQYGITAFTSLAELCAAVDVAVVATPTIIHAQIARQCLEAGCHVLLEKPIAVTVADGEMLIETAKRLNRVLMIGLSERFNPATLALQAQVKPNDIFAIELQRCAPTQGRDRSADVIFDLMIHDLDLALAFTQSKVVEVQATGHCAKNELIDHAVALLRFANGATATITCSHVSPQRKRCATLLTRGPQYTIDFGTRKIEKHSYGEYLTGPDGLPQFGTKVETIDVPEGDALTQQLHFLLAATQQQPIPTHLADSGQEALRLVLEIHEQITGQLNCS